MTTLAAAPTRCSVAESLAADMRLLGRCQRRILERIGDLDRRGAYRADRASSMVAWVMEQLSLGYPSARDYVTVAAELPQLPALADGLSSGAVSFDQLRILVRIATPSDDADLAQRAATWSLAQTESHVRIEETRRADAARARLRAKAAPPPTPPTPRAARPAPGQAPLMPPIPAPAPASCGATRPELRPGTLRLRPHGGGGNLDGWLPSEDYAAVESVLLALAKGADRDPATGAFLPLGERLASALVGLVTRDAGGRDDGLAPLPTLVVHCDVGLLTGESDGTSVAMVDDRPISAEVARRLACDAQLQVAVDADGVTLDLGRRRRAPSRVLAGEVLRRDVTCRFPGCRARHFLQIHHLVPWAQGGPTNLDNLAAHCPCDHRRIHHDGWKVAGDANTELRYTSPDGRTLRSMPDPGWEAPRRRRTTDRPQH